MDLENPQLEPFEPKLLGLFAIAHTSGIWELEKKGFRLEDIAHSPSANRVFLRGCHYGYDLAQRRIGALVIEIELAINERTQELKTLRRAREERAGAILEQIHVLKSRQIVLRRLVDSILYGIIRGENWLLRRFTMDLQIHNIDPAVIEKTTRVAVDRNRENRLKFSLISDLTTVVQIGDLIEIDLTGKKDRRWSIIELKEGRVNELLTGMLAEKHGVPAEEDFALMKKIVGESGLKQAKRMLKQQKRMRELTRIVETDRGVDPMHDVEIYMTPDPVHLEDYHEEIEKVFETTKKKGVGAAEVDGCLRLFGIAREPQGRSQGIARHHFFHMANPGRPCAFTGARSAAERNEEIGALKSVPYFIDLAAYNMTIPIAEPIFIWSNRDMVIDLVMGRIRLFVQFDVEAFFRLAAKENIKMRWIVGKEAEDIRDISMRFPGSSDAWGIHAELPDGDTQTLLAGFISRAFTNFARPRQLVDLIKRIPSQLAKTKIDKTAGLE
jgi:hypothetical protein